MQNSTTIPAVIIQLLVIFLPMLGIKVGSDQLVSAVQTIIVVVTGLWIWYRRYKVGDVKLFGGKKYSK